MCLFLLISSHDFIGEFTTSYRELSRGQSQFNVYEVGSVCMYVYVCSCVFMYKEGGSTTGMS